MATQNFSLEEFNKIEQLCKECGQINNDESLSHIIINDNLFLTKTHITHQQISDLLQKIIYHHDFISSNSLMDNEKLYAYNYSKIRSSFDHKITNITRSYIFNRFIVI